MIIFSSVKRLTHGFTLIELMIVVTIIGILMSSGIVAFTQLQKKSRDSKRRADLEAIGRALEQRYQDLGNYPNMNGFYSNGDEWIWGMQPVIGGYFPSGSLPVDPINTSTYRYGFGSLRDSMALNPTPRFILWVRLEIPNGNCSGLTNWNSATDVNSYSTVWNTTNTGSFYCVTQKQ